MLRELGRRPAFSSTQHTHLPSYLLGKGNPKPDGAESKVTNTQVLWLQCLPKMNVNPCKVYVQCNVCRKQAHTFFICLDQLVIIAMILEAKQNMKMLYFYGCSITFNISTVCHCIISSTFSHNTAWHIRYLPVIIRWALICFLAESCLRRSVQLWCLSN